MRRSFFCLLSLFFFPVILVAQQQEEIRLQAFDKIDISDNALVQLKRGEKEKLQLIYEGIERENIEISVENGVFSIRARPRSFKNVKIRAVLTYVTLKKIFASSVAEISAAELLKSDSLFIDLKSGASVYISLDVRYLNARVIENALFSADGYADHQVIDVSTTGTFSGYQLEGESAKINATLGGTAKVFVGQELDAKASTNGYIGFKGDPDKQTIDSGPGGTIEPMR